MNPLKQILNKNTLSLFPKNKTFIQPIMKKERFPLFRLLIHTLVGYTYLYLLTGCSLFQKEETIRFGIISDAHQDLQPDAQNRLREFIEKATEEKPDFIIQLGDLSHGIGTDSILNVWNLFPGKKYHVLGNHDSDGASKETIIQKQGMPGKYYSFDEGGCHFIVLDLNYVRLNGNYLDFEKGNYFKAKKEDRDLIHPEQLEWLKEDLKKTNKPCFIFSHQGWCETWAGGTAPNGGEILKIIREANAGKEAKVIACFFGHLHIDEYKKLENVHYFHINSASYYWIDGEPLYSRGNMAEYKSPLYSFISINPKKRTIEIEEAVSEFIPPAPEKTHFPLADRLSPKITGRTVTF